MKFCAELSFKRSLHCAAESSKFEPKSALKRVQFCDALFESEYLMNVVQNWSWLWDVPVGRGADDVSAGVGV